MIKTLAIETSCDDTSIGIVSYDGSRFEVEKLLAYSQVQDHQKYGGVVPEIASRLHSEKVIELLQTIWWDDIKKVDFVSVTAHPWLPGSLVVGKAVAATLWAYFEKPVVAVNHIYGHIFSLLLERNREEIAFPLVVLTASGGHNDIYVVTSPSQIERVGWTLDDAAGECFDKVARMLGGPYPGGQWISEKANKSTPSPSFVKEGNIILPFKRIFLSKESFEFSFSWMKSQVSGLLKEFEKKCQIPPTPLCPALLDQDQGGHYLLPEELVCEIAYEFQEAVVEVLVKKLIRAWIKYGAKTLWIAWGVSCNERLWEYLNEKLPPGLVAIRPVKKVYSTDNAAMIGVAGILGKW
jgi:N6-L-threonylcarbamoyladenine synthase